MQEQILALDGIIVQLQAKLITQAPPLQPKGVETTCTTWKMTAVASSSTSLQTTWSGGNAPTTTARTSSFAGGQTVAS